MNSCKKFVALFLLFLMLVSQTALGEGICEQYDLTFDHLYYQFSSAEEPITLPYALNISFAKDNGKVSSGILSLISGKEEILGINLSYMDDSIFAWANSGDVGLSHVLEMPISDIITYLKSRADIISQQPQISLENNDSILVLNKLLKSYLELCKIERADQNKLYKDILEQMAASKACTIIMTNHPSMEESSMEEVSEIYIEINDFNTYLDVLCTQDNIVSEFWTNYVDSIYSLSGGKLNSEMLSSILGSMRMSSNIQTKTDSGGMTTTDVDATLKMVEEDVSLEILQMKINVLEYCNPEKPDNKRLELSLAYGIDDLFEYAMSVNLEQASVDDTINGSFSMAFSTDLFDAFSFNPETITDVESSEFSAENAQFNKDGPEIDNGISYELPKITGELSVDYTILSDTETISRITMKFESGGECSFIIGLNIHADHRLVDAIPPARFETANKLNPFTAEKNDCFILLNSVSTLIYHMLTTLGFLAE